MSELVQTFPTEILARVLIELSYRSLLKATTICKEWQTVILHDPALQVAMFKKSTHLPGTCYWSI